MTVEVDELACLLRATHRQAKQGDTTLSVHLYGIQYADELGEYPGKVGEVVRLAGIGDHVPAINDARKLAMHVSLGASESPPQSAPSNPLMEARVRFGVMLFTAVGLGVGLAFGFGVGWFLGVYAFAVFDGF